MSEGRTKRPDALETGRWIQWAVDRGMSRRDAVDVFRTTRSREQNAKAFRVKQAEALQSGRVLRVD